MNYFEHHIGDYAEATAHLTFLEDGAYSRLIRKYYALEKPLPADPKAVQRLVGARTKDEKEAVSAMLEEFFDLREDGWHQSRCDEEIAAYQAGEPERAVKRSNEETRMRKHREERARLFAALNAAGQHAAWNTPVTQLREMVTRLKAEPATPAPRPETPPATEPVTGPVTQPATTPATPATATQTPVPNTQTPIPDTNQEKKVVSSPPAPAAAKAKPEATGSRLPADWALTPELREWCVEHRPDLDPDEVAAGFKDFWVSKPGKDGRKADWFATWRNWCRSQRAPWKGAAIEDVRGRGV